ncbi:hypothetical protein ACHWQZ_G005517 [Mnemiopsis leidyi]
MKSSVGAVVTLLSLTVMLGKMGGAVETTKCYNCTIEETKYKDTDGKDQVNRKIYDSEQHGELEACPESTCNGSCVSAIDTRLLCLSLLMMELLKWWERLWKSACFT